MVAYIGYEVKIVRANYLLGGGMTADTASTALGIMKPLRQTLTTLHLYTNINNNVALNPYFIS